MAEYPVVTRNVQRFKEKGFKTDNPNTDDCSAMQKEITRAFHEMKDEFKAWDKTMANFHRYLRQLKEHTDGKIYFDESNTWFGNDRHTRVFIKDGTFRAFDSKIFDDLSKWGS